MIKFPVWEGVFLPNIALHKSSPGYKRLRKAFNSRPEAFKKLQKLHEVLGAEGLDLL